MITTQTIFIQVAAILVVYFSVSINQNKWNIFKWNDDNFYCFIVTIFIIHCVILTFNCLFL